MKQIQELGPRERFFLYRLFGSGEAFVPALIFRLVFDSRRCQNVVLEEEQKIVG